MKRLRIRKKQRKSSRMPGWSLQMKRWIRWLADGEVYLIKKGTTFDKKGYFKTL